MTRTEAEHWYKRVRNLELTDKNRRKEVLRRLASRRAYQSQDLPGLWDLSTLTPDGEYDISRMCEPHDLVSSDLIKELFDEGLVTVRIDQGWAVVAGNLTWPVLYVRAAPVTVRPTSSPKSS